MCIFRKTKNIYIYIYIYIKYHDPVVCGSDKMSVYFLNNMAVFNKLKDEFR